MNYTIQMNAIAPYLIPEVLIMIIMLYKAVLTFESVVLFNMLYKVVFESVVEILV